MREARARRWPRHLKVRFWPRGSEEEVHQGLTADISLGGVFIRTRELQKPGTRLTLRVGEEDESFVVEGVVARAVQTPPALQSVRPTGIGVRFLSVEELVDEILPRVSARADSDRFDRRTGPIAAEVRNDEPPPGEAPSDSRAANDTSERETPSDEGGETEPAPQLEEVPPTDQASQTSEVLEPKPPRRRRRVEPDERTVYRVDFPDRNRFRRVFERDVRTGGLFVPTGEPLPMDATVWIDVRIDGVDHDPVQVEATVVHRVDPETVGLGGPDAVAGMGVQFTDAGRAMPSLRSLLDA